MVRDHSPDGASPIVPVHMLLQFSGVIAADHAVEPSWEQLVLLPEGKIADATLMGVAIFSDEMIIGVEVDGIDLISTDVAIFIKGVDSARPNCILMFVLCVACTDICIRY